MPEFILNSMSEKKQLQINTRLVEPIIFAIIWLTIFLIPVFTNEQYGQIKWQKVFDEWILITPFLIVFVLNIYLLIPLLLSKKQHINYVLWALLISTFFVCSGREIHNQLFKEKLTGMPPMVIGPGAAPMEFSKEMPPPEGFNSKLNTPDKSENVIFLQNLVIALLVVGTGTGYKVLFFWIREEKERKTLQESIRKEEPTEEYLFVKADYKMVRIKISEILYIESANEYIKIFLEKGEAITTFMRLKNIESKLPVSQFMRVQRSFIVNLEKIMAVEKNRIFIEHKKFIPIGEQYKEAFQEFLGKNFVK